jgi:hypothetical protein
MSSSDNDDNNNSYSNANAKKDFDYDSLNKKDLQAIMQAIDIVMKYTRHENDTMVIKDLEKYVDAFLKFSTFAFMSLCKLIDINNAAINNNNNNNSNSNNKAESSTTAGYITITPSQTRL